MTPLQSKKIRLAKLNEAYDALIGGVKTYNLSTGTTSRSLTKRDLKEIREEIKQTEIEISALESGGLRFGRIVPRCNG
jgi:hypothetical protein